MRCERCGKETSELLEVETIEVIEGERKVNKRFQQVCRTCAEETGY